MMADEAPNPPFNFERSVSHKVIHSNFYRYRIGMGDFYIGFGTIRDELPGSPNTVIEEITVAMTWQQTKLLSQTLSAAISIIEKEGGELVVPSGTPEAVAAEHAQSVNNLRIMFQTAAPKAAPKAN
jgi:hypothetical protein